MIRNCSLVLAVLVAGTVRADDAATASQRFAMNPFHANIGRIASVEKDGTVQLADVSNPRFALGRLANLPDLAEGLYIGLVANEFTLSTEDTRLVRIRVESVGDDRSATLKVSPRAAENIEKGEQIVLFRPPGASTKQVEACPDFAKVDDGRETTVLGKSSVNQSARLSQSRNNLKQIGIALHNYHDVYGIMPPAVVYGPDGKPWHSWRVLILPYLEQSNLYDRYRFDEPWDGPNNKKLLGSMPTIYADPIHQGPNDGFYTHYAAVTGPGSAFTATGLKTNGKDQRTPFNDTDAALRFRDFTDGLSNTIMFGSVGPMRKIPWMKPEDVVFEKEFPLPGEKGSFDTPYGSRSGNAGVFAWCDGSVRTIRDDIDADDWRRIVTRNDGEPFSGDVPGLEASNRVRPGTRAMQFVEVIREGNTVRAKLVSGSE